MVKKVLILYPNERYTQAVLRAGLTPVYDIGSSADGLLLTGGGDVMPCAYGMPDISAKDTDFLRDQTELWAINKFTAQNKPVMGICRGMQIVNVFFGGTLSEDIPMHDRINGADRMHRIIAAPSSVIHGIVGKSAYVTSAHHQAVNRVGSGLEVTAESIDGIIECLEGKNIILTQFHPERMTLSGGRFFDYFASLF